MPSMHYMLVEQDGEANVTAFVPGVSKPLTAHSSHPNFDRIVEQLKDDDAYGIADLFDVSETVSKRFMQLSERVSVANGRVYFDGDEIDDSLTKQIVRFLDEDEDDWSPLVWFMENVASNPNEHSREQLYEWLKRHEFSIDQNGMLIGYKGVSSDYLSIHSGPGIVNGRAVNERLDNSVGNTVEIARSLVHHDPSQGCSAGLHVGTYEFAKGYASGGVLLKVIVNPRDVVSVPTDCDAQKVRVCRYTVAEVITERISSAYARAAVNDEDFWGDECWSDADDDYGDDDECCCGPAPYDPSTF